MLNRRRVSQFERDYLKQLKEEFDVSNPQDSQPPSKSTPSIPNAWQKHQPSAQSDTSVTDISDRLQSIESFIDEYKKTNTSSTNNPDPPPSLRTDTIATMISTQVSSQTSSLRDELTTKFQDIEKRFGTVETSITETNTTTTRLDTSITRLEETNSELLKFLKTNHSIPASGQNELPRAKG